jgi:bifunctional DNA-binding transcriptional regulator/antitoxin component of YhaV-PrlF toxin-antitoxin module
MRRLVPITKGGQISLPADVRHRWGARKVVIVDEGEQLVVKPVPADPIRALMGKFPLPDGLTVDGLTLQDREDETAIEERKQREYEYGNLRRVAE